MKTKVDKKNILKQMFDVRPTKKTGVLDTERILSLGSILDTKKIEEQKKALNRKFLLDLGGWEAKKKEENLSLAKNPVEDICRTEKDMLDIEAARFKFFHESVNNASYKETIREGTGGIIREEEKPKNKSAENKKINTEEPIFIKESESGKDIIDFEKFTQDVKKGFAKIGNAAAEAASPLFYHWKRSLAAFAIASCIISSSVGALAFYQKETEKASVVKDMGLQGFYSILDAKEDIKNQNFKQAREKFQEASKIFKKAKEEITPAENFLAKIPDLFGNSLPSSGIHLINSGERISSAGSKISEALIPLFNSDKPAIDANILEAVKKADILLAEALGDIKIANAEAKEISENALPENAREYAKSLKDGLPKIQNILGKSANYLSGILEILGNENPKKYLLLFQNNSELRATGGFIGSFAAVDVYKGNISEIKVDGIYNPAGQLLEKIIPPLPIKKAAESWNIFDANYFADFPVSAKKIAWFYEKTGGPTIDGIISFTPKVLEDLLKILGPVELSQYEITVTAKNFVDTVQFEVEENYDKIENKPKKIIADLAQVLIEKILSSKSEDWQEILEVLKNNLDEKHILIYFSSQNQQRMIEEEGWAGEALASPQDYLQVVHTNINGYKTDRKIQEKISHEINISDIGEIVDTVTITKKHNGGETGYDWYDRQNGDFLRVFVPTGSELISAEGFSKEEIYSKTKDFSGFIKDPDIELIEKTMERDLKTGVFKFQESKKTVFAGWMYTDPGQVSTVKLSYRLPFKALAGDSNYNILYQKQSGHPGLQLTTRILKSGNLVDERIRNLFEDESIDLPLSKRGIEGDARAQ